MANLVSLFFLLFGFWILLSGHFEPLLLVLGSLSCIGVVGLASRMYAIDHESHPIHLSTKIPQYWLWLAWEVIKSNIAVVKLVWHPAMPISPTVVRVKASQLTDLGKIVFANSITLTPGTVSLDVGTDEIEVHALTEEIAQDLQSGVMDRRVTEME